MNKPHLNIREFTEADLPAVRELYREVWSYNRPEIFDSWRYLQTPAGIVPAAMAFDGDRAAGFYTVWPTRLRIGNEVVLGAQSMDTMTHPDYQGQGLFTRLALACFDICRARQIEVLYGFPNPLSYPGFVNRLNWDHTGDVTHWIRPLAISRHPRVPPLVGGVADLITALLPRGAASSFEVSVDRPSPSEIGALAEEWHLEPRTCSIDRSDEWMKWRLSAEAANSYEWVCARRNGQIVAAGAWGMQDDSWAAPDNRAHLVELFGSEAAGRRTVLRAIIERARNKKATLLETITNKVSVTSCLRNAGFFRHRQAPLIVRGLTDRNLGANIHDHNAWRIMGSDVDTF